MKGEVEPLLAPGSRADLEDRWQEENTRRKKPSRTRRSIFLIQKIRFEYDIEHVHMGAMLLLHT